MKKLSLKAYSQHELHKLTMSNSLCVTQMLKDVEKDNVRLYAALLCWVFFNNLEVKEKSCLNDDLKQLKLKGTKDEKTVLKYLENSSNVELQKFAQSYKSENKRREGQEMKDRYRVYFLKRQQELKLSDDKLCQLANLNSDNFHAFYRKNQNNKLSMAKCKQLFEVLMNM